MRAQWRDSLEFLFSDSVVAGGRRSSLSLDVPRGGTATAHLLLDGLPVGGSLRLEVRSEGGSRPRVEWFRLIDVPVEVNTGRRSFVEKEGEKPNPFVIRRAPFRVRDAMEPVGARVRTDSPAMALRLHVPVPSDARPGVRTYVASVSSGRESAELGLSVRVHRAVVPPVGRESFPYTNWFSLANMAERHAESSLRPPRLTGGRWRGGLQVWSEAHWAMIRRYAQMMVRARQNTFWIPWGDVFTRAAGALVLDRARLRRIVKVFTSAGMHYIEGGHVASRTGGEWQAKTFSVVLDGPPATTPRGNADIARAARQLVEEIDSNGWRSRWIQHVTDEPTAENAVDYRILVGIVRRHMPGLPILDATMDPSLAGSVDIWCPQAQEYQAHRETFEAQRALGDRVWFYTCCVPGGPWLNRLLDMELLRPALFGWAAALYNLDGFLHWGLNHYKKGQDPFEQNVVQHGKTNRLPAGDTHVVYPGPDGPWSSVRLEAQREGFEDCELLRVVREGSPAAARRIARMAIRAFDDYTKDVAVFRRARRALLAAAAFYG